MCVLEALFLFPPYTPLFPKPKMIPLTQKLSFVPIFSAAQFSFLYISQDSDNISIRNQKKKSIRLSVRLSYKKYYSATILPTWLFNTYHNIHFKCTFFDNSQPKINEVAHSFLEFVPTCKKISLFHQFLYEIKPILESLDQSGHAHFWPCSTKQF